MLSYSCEVSRGTLPATVAVEWPTSGLYARSTARLGTVPNVSKRLDAVQAGGREVGIPGDRRRARTGRGQDGAATRDAGPGEGLRNLRARAGRRASRRLPEAAGSEMAVPALQPGRAPPGEGDVKGGD